MSDWTFERLIAGPMCAHKTKAIAWRLRFLEACGYRVVAFKHAMDLGRYPEVTSMPHRYSLPVPLGVSSALTTLDGYTFPAWAIESLEGVLEATVGFGVVGFDEAQFFPAGELLEAVRLLEEQGTKVIVSQLSYNFRGQPFGAFSGLITHARKLQMMHAVCVRCGESALFTQRLTSEGLPAYWSDLEVVVGSTDIYFPACGSCLVVPQSREPRERWLPFELP